MTNKTIKTDTEEFKAAAEKLVTGGKQSAPETMIVWLDISLAHVPPSRQTGKALTASLIKPVAYLSKN
jgi:hypothetical protein